MSRQLALIIGNSEYDDQHLAQLSTPGADVESLARVLEDPRIGGFHEVVWMLNQPVSAVRREISRFLTHEKRPDDLLVLYFSGHGVLDEQGRLHLAAKDTERDLLQATAVPAAFIEGELDRSPSRRQVFILDCCHSGAFSRGSKGVVGTSVGTSTAFQGNGYGRVILTATDATQYAWEGEELRGEAETSVFTRYLIQGLESGAADLNEDGLVSLDELYDYTYDQIMRVSARQKPHKYSYLQEGDLIIARNPHSGSRQLLPAEILRSLDNGRPWEREGAIIELGHILRGDDADVAAAAAEVLARLSQSEDARVAEAAVRQLSPAEEAAPISLAQDLDEESTRPRAGAAHVVRQAAALPAGFGLTQKIVVAPDFSQVAVAADGIWLLAAEDLRPLQHLALPTGYPLCLGWSPDGTQIAAGGSDSAIFIWDARSGRLQRTLEGHDNAVHCVSWHPESRQLASASQDGTVRLWQAGRKGARLVLTGHQESVLAVDYSPDGRKVASAGSDGRIILWDAESGNTLSQVEAHKGGVNTLAWSRDGKRVASGGADSTIRVWDAAGRALRLLPQHSRPVQAVAWSPDGRRLASAADDGTLRIFDAAELRPQRLLTPLPSRRGESVPQLALAWTDQGSRLASCGGDGILRLWNAVTGKEMVELGALTSALAADRPVLPVPPAPQETAAVSQEPALESAWSVPAEEKPEIEAAAEPEAAAPEPEVVAPAAQPPAEPEWAQLRPEPEAQAPEAAVAEPLAVEEEAAAEEEPAAELAGDAQEMTPAVKRTLVRSILVERFDLSELEDLAFDLGVDFEILPGDDKRDKARGLMQYLERRGRLGELLEVAARQRDDIDWQQFVGLDHPSAD